MEDERRWLDPAYLQRGSRRQQTAWLTLHRLAIFQRLARFAPVLTGTIPIGLDMPESDLDIICQAEDLDAFEAAVVDAYGRHSGFRCHRRVWQDRPAVVAAFHGDHFPVQLFAQDLPVCEQNAFRHMVVEDRLLHLGGDAARAAILALRRAGMKTEPAFAAHFGLDGDPYAELLRLSRLGPPALAAEIARISQLENQT